MRVSSGLCLFFESVGVWKATGDVLHLLKCPKSKSDIYIYIYLRETSELPFFFEKEIQMNAKSVSGGG